MIAIRVIHGFRFIEQFPMNAKEIATNLGLISIQGVYIWTPIRGKHIGEFHNPDKRELELYHTYDTDRKRIERSLRFADKKCLDKGDILSLHYNLAFVKRKLKELEKAGLTPDEEAQGYEDWKILYDAYVWFMAHSDVVEVAEEQYCHCCDY